MISLEEQDYEKINIIVGGRTAVGKSTIIFLIIDALEKEGLTIEFDGGLDFEDKEDFIKKMTPYIEKRAKAIDRPVKIKEIQFARKPIINNPNVVVDTDKEEFAASITSNFNERWDVFKSKPEDLVGKKVISIRNGFSGSAGQIMIINEANNTQIRFIGCEESINISEHHLGWGCPYEDRANSFIFYNK